MGGQIFSEILPYLEVNQGNQEEVENVEQVSTPNIIGENIKEAKKILKESELELNLNIELGEDVKEEEIIIKDQTPKPGITVNKGSNVYAVIEK